MIKWNSILERALDRCGGTEMKELPLLSVFQWSEPFSDSGLGENRSFMRPGVSVLLLYPKHLNTAWYMLDTWYTILWMKEGKKKKIDRWGRRKRVKDKPICISR